MADDRLIMDDMAAAIELRRQLTDALTMRENQALCLLSNNEDCPGRWASMSADLAGAATDCLCFSKQRDIAFWLLTAAVLFAMSGDWVACDAAARAARAVPEEEGEPDEYRTLAKYILSRTDPGRIDFSDAGHAACAYRISRVLQARRDADGEVSP